MNRSILITAALLTFSSLSRAETVSIRADNWFPFNGDPGSPTPGYQIEIAQQALAKGGHSVDYKTLPWERSLKEVRAGNIDCVVGAYKGDAPDLVYPDEAMGMEANAFFTRQDSIWKYEGIASLSTQKVVAMVGYSYGDELDAWLKTRPKNVVLISGDDGLGRALKMMEGKHVDVFVESRNVFKAKTSQLGMESHFRHAGDVDELKPVYVACSPVRESSKAYVKLITEGVRDLRKSGELGKILAKYGLTDWVK